VFFASARTRIPPERIRAIECGETRLCDDAHGRGAARQLAQAIGADPEQALARLTRAPAAAAPRAEARRAAHPRALALARVLPPLLALVAVAGLTWGALRLLERAQPGAARAPLYRPDYVEHLLEQPPSEAR
jgi:hypothetical protein